MPAATDRFSESISRRIGIRTRQSAIASTAGVRPIASEPTSKAIRSGPVAAHEVVQRRCRLARRQRDQREPVRAQDAEAGRPFGHSRERHRERGRHRGPNRFPVERIAAAGAQQHRADAERRRAPKDPADVVGVGDVLEHDNEPGLRQHLDGGDERWPLDERQTSAVHVEPGDLEKVRHWSRRRQARSGRAAKATGRAPHASTC